MPNSPRLNWPYPKEYEDPFYAKFVSMIEAMDASFFTTREDKNFVMFGGGVFTFNSISGLLSWTAPIQAVSATSGFRWRIPNGSGGGNVTLQDGEFFYVELTRNPQTAQDVAAVAGSRISPNDDALIIAQRLGDSIVFRNGAAISNGQSVVLFNTQILTQEVRYVGVGGLQTNDTSTFSGVGGIFFDPTLIYGSGTGFTRTIKFRAIIETNNILLPTEVRLFNITDAAVVAGSTLSTTSLTPSGVTSAALTLPATQKVYEVQIRLVGVPAPADLAACKLAELAVTWV
jgi:hypothetical protein